MKSKITVIIIVCVVVLCVIIFNISNKSRKIDVNDNYINDFDDLENIIIDDTSKIVFDPITNQNVNIKTGEKVE